MARTIEQIENSIINRLDILSKQKKLKIDFKASASSAAEWKLWTNCFAYVIHTFEFILDSFKNEMNKTAEGMYTGSLAWYKEMCYRFQSGHTLVFDKKKMQPVYETQDDSKKIVKTATVSIVGKTLVFKVATVSEDTGAMEPLSLTQLEEFNAYLEMIKFAGTQTTVVSTYPDKIYYNINVYYDPSFPKTELQKNIEDSLNYFRTEQPFGGVIYRHKLLEVVTRVPGVVTARINSLMYQQQLPKPILNPITPAPRLNMDYVPIFLSQFMEIETGAELYAGYFDYAKDCKLKLININQL